MAVIEIEDAPRKAKELFQKGFGAMERNNLDYAIDMFLAALEIEPRLLQARKFLRAAEIGRFKEQKGGSFTHSLSSLKGLGKTMRVKAALKKNPERAVSAAEALLRIDPLNKSFIRTFVEAATAADLKEAAAQTLELAREHYPQDTDLLEQLAALYMDIDRTHEGRECYEMLAHLKPNDQRILKKLKDAAAIDTISKGGWQQARSYRDVIKDTKEATLLEQEAKAVKTDRDIGDLIEETRQKIEREPGNINYRRALAELYARSERLDDAVRTLEEAQKMTGGGDPQIDRALSALKIKRYDALIAQAEAAGRGEEAERLRREKDAYLVEDAADRVRRYPNDLQFKYEYGILLFKHGELNEAIHQFQQSQRNPQRRIRSLYYLGLCFKAKQQYDIAAEQLEKALSELPTMNQEKKDVLYELGEVYEKMGDKEKAVAAFKEIYAVDIEYRDVAERIERGYPA